MKKLRGVAQALASLVAVTALILVLVLAFKSVSGRGGAAPAATSGAGYPGPGVTPAPGGLPSPTSILDTIGFTPTPALNDAPDQFDPKTYGLPDTMAGYTVLGIVTSDNKACLPPGYKELVLKSTDPTLQDAIKNDRTADVIKAMGDLGLNTTGWGISVGGPNSTREQLIAGVQAWNKENETSGCSYSGPAIEASTPTSQKP